MRATILQNGRFLKKLAIIMSWSFIFQNFGVYCANDQNIAETEQRKIELDNQQKEITEKIHNDQHGIDEETVKKSSYENKIRDLKSKIDISNRKIMQCDNRISDLDNQIKSIQDDAALKKETLKNSLVSIYVAGATSALEVLMSAKTFDDFFDKAEFVKSINETVYDLIEELLEMVKEIKVKQSELAELKLQAQNERDILSQNIAELQKLIDASEQIIAGLNDAKQLDEKDLEENIAAINEVDNFIKNYYEEQKRREEEEKKRRLAEEKRRKEEEQRRKEEERRRIAEEKKRREAEFKKKKQQLEITEKERKLQTLAEANKKLEDVKENVKINNIPIAKDDKIVKDKPNFTGLFRWPVPGFRKITSGFYDTESRNKMHGALDIAGVGVHGATVIAAADGKVIKAVTGNSGYGSHIILDHGNGYIAIYAHLSIVSATTGEYVTAGTPIGNVGSTGFSTGPHLHFEVRKNGIQIDPSRMFLD